MYIVEVMQSVSLSRFFENQPIYWIFCKLERSFLKFTSAAVISLDGKRNSSFIQKNVSKFPLIIQFFLKFALTNMSGRSFFSPLSIF